MTTARGLRTLAATIVAGVCAGTTTAGAGSQRSGSSAQPSCRYEQNCDCTVPGITVRWKAAYCMSLAETDDLENEAVSRCLAQPDPELVAALGACAQNEYWKAQFCRAAHPRDERQMQACIADRSLIPRFIEFGPGAARPQ